MSILEKKNIDDKKNNLFRLAEGLLTTILRWSGQFASLVDLKGIKSIGKRLAISYFLIITHAFINVRITMKIKFYSVFLLLLLTEGICLWSRIWFVIYN
jgi:hypothetical protein